MIDINWEHQGITNPQLLNLDVNNQVVTSSKIKSDPNITLSNDNNSNNNLNLFGGWLGQILSSGIGTSSNNIALNIIKGNAIFDGLEKDVGSSVAGTVSGITGNLIGQGINKIGNNSRLSRGIGQGIATGIGTVGGTILSNLIRNGNIAGKAAKLFGTAGKGLKAFSTGVESVDEAGNVTKAAGAINPYALGATVLGTGLQAALGPSHEYDGRHGGITKGMDTAYDLVLSAVGFIPGYGQAISGAMALNKGLSNVFGSTDGMTKTDAILGSAFMPAPVKWVNMWGSKKTLNFDNQSILNILSAYDFMQGGYGNLDKRFDLAREEANKRYGTFSQGARRRADRNIEFANNAWNTILDLADLNEIQNIRSQYMSSINNQRYSLMISGGYNPIYVGKQGMKILNNATNHNMGLRLLSAAALIDNKQMILSAQGGTKVRTTGGAGYVPPAININTEKIKDKIRKNLYDNLYTHSYQSLSDAVFGALGIKSSAINRIIEDDNELKNTNGAYIDFDNYEGPTDDAIWATYLNIPKNQRRKKSGELKISKYTPSVGKENDTVYYEFPITDPEYIIREGNDLPINGNKVAGMDYYGAINVGDFTIGRGYDSKGEYRSVYDKWDLNPFKGIYRKTGLIGNIGNKLFGKKGDLSFGIGKPVNLYNRIYLDDYYGVSEPTHATYLPEVTIYNKSK